MKYVLSIILPIVFLVSSYGQNAEIEKIDSLVKVIKSKQNQLNSEIIVLQLRIDSLLDIKHSLIEQQYYGESFICIQSTYIFPTDKTDYKTGYLIKKDDKVKVIERVGDYYKVIHNDRIGYMLPGALMSENQILNSKIEEKEREIKEIQESIEKKNIEDNEAQNKVVIERSLNEFTHKITRQVATFNGIQEEVQITDPYIMIKQLDNGKYDVGLKDNSYNKFVFVTVSYNQIKDGIYIYFVIANDKEFENLNYIGSSEKLSNMAKGVKGDVIFFYNTANNLFISTK